MASSSLGTLTLDLIARTGGFVKGMTKAERSSKKWRKQVERDLKKLRGQFATFAKMAAGAGVAAAGAFTILAKEGLQFVDSQAKMATRLGSTIDDLRAVQIAASDYGIEQGRLTSSLASYTKRLGDAARGTGEAQKAYEALGLEASELVNLPLPEQLALIAERIAEVDSAAERASIADRLMSGGRGMVNLFAEGGDAIRNAVDEVEEFGLKLSQVDAARVEAANDAMSRIGRSTEGVRTQMVVALAPAIQTVADEFNNAAKASKGFADTGDDIAGGVVESVSFVVDSVEGLKRTFELAGSTIALFALQSQRAMLALGETIIDAPVNSINAVIEGLNKISPIDIEPVGITQLSRDLDNELALIEGAIAEGKQDIQDILMEPMPSAVFGARLAENERLQDGRDAGLGMDSGISSNAIAAARAVAEAMNRASEAANDSADADEDKADKSDTAADAVKTLADASDGASRALDSIGSADWGRGAMPSGDDEGMSAVRRAIENGKDPAPYWLEPNPTARPTWSTDYLSNPESDVAERVSASAPWSSVGAQSMAKVQSSAQSMTDHAAAAKDRGKVIIKVVGENGNTEGTLEGEDAFVRSLADALSGVAAGSR
ncbi:putative tail tape measure protein [Halomonas phage QHHSV-1]|nr:putative tail tape measure protein [Halomonas phage QHHSV-1]